MSAPILPYSSLTRKTAPKMRANKIKAKRATPRVRKEVVRLTGEAMTELRWQAYERAGGEREHPATKARCELALRGVCLGGANWDDGQLAHNKSRGASGADVLGNVRFACKPCHGASHNCGGKPIQVSKKSGKGAGA